MNHLGIKPERGGRPPRERRVGVSRVCIAGDFVHTVERPLKFVVPKWLREMNTVEVITI